MDNQGQGALQFINYGSCTPPKKKFSSRSLALSLLPSHHHAPQVLLKVTDVGVEYTDAPAAAA